MFVHNTTERFKCARGTWLTQSLFYECYRSNEGYPPLYTFKDNDHKGMLSIKKIYLALEDPTEYRVATEYFGGWEHWKVLTNCNFLKPYLNQWRDELEIKLKCKELQKLLQDEDKNFVVSKFLINREWEVKRGRPSKEELARKERINDRVNQQIDNDFKLIINEK